MSEEETIKRIEETLKLTELCQRTTNAPKISKNYIWDMRTLLDLYNKEKEENKYLKSQIPTDKIFYFSYKDFISKDKIREIVNIMDNSESEFAKLPNGKEIVLSDNCLVIEYLRELLEE